MGGARDKFTCDAAQPHLQDHDSAQSELDGTSVEESVHSSIEKDTPSAPVELYKKQKLNSRLSPVRERLPSPPSSHNSKKVNSSTASTSRIALLNTRLGPFEIDNSEEESETNSTHNETTIPVASRTQSPLISSSEYLSEEEDESDGKMNFSQSPTMRRARLYSLPDKSVKITDWRVKGRFLEYCITFKNDAADSPPRWVRSLHMKGQAWDHRIKHYWSSNGAENNKFMTIVGQLRCHGSITMNYTPAIHGVSSSTRREISFYTSDLGCDVGDDYTKQEGHKLDYGHWREAVALFWRQRLYDIQICTVRQMLRNFDFCAANSNPGQVLVGDCNAKIIPYDDGDEDEQTMVLVLAEEVAGAMES